MTAKARILECALDELERSGVEAFSLRAVGAAAGVTPMAIYRHYRNREDLLFAAGEEAFTTWKARVDAIKAAGPLDWLRKLCRSYAAFALDEPARFDACFVLRSGVERLYPADFRAGKSPVVALGVKHIEDAQKRGLLAPGDALEATMSLWAQVHGLVMLHRSGRFAMKRAAFLSLCERCVAHVLAGLGARA
jgi:AcrR family transcriptional regulator